jgi:eukaryotic-like serine/threonine-protein kinase
MPLASGTQLGPYEIIAPLGAGGMGEVYRARDTRLDRIVAIKILPVQFSSDPIRKQRFEREAKTISSLKHPHICVLHDVGSQDGLDYLVMECVEGETLAKRLDKGALPLEQVLKYGMQIADALDKAHRSGVIHRDLKPGNIMLTPSGAKLLDFGLAKPAAPLASLATLTAAVMQTSPMTEQGAIVGTFQYMSPEQVEGKELDGRSDIFSLGTVVYEMLTGQRAFPGKSQLSVASAIIEKEPVPISTLKPLTPPALDHAIRRCLAKDPEERWQTARDLMLELKWIGEAGPQTAKPPVARSKLSSWMSWGAAGSAGVLALVFGIGYVRSNHAQQPVRAFVLPPPNTTFNSVGLEGGPVTVSPDGQQLVFSATDDSGNHLLWVRTLDSVSAHSLPGTEGGAWPFWSPDSRFLGFFAEGKLKKVESPGGPAETLCAAPLGRGGTWSPNGTILFAPTTQAPLHRVSDAGGAAVPVTKLDDSHHESSHRWPYFLPDGQHFIFFERADQSGIYTGTLDSQETKFLLATESNAIYASPGYLLFWREGSLMAQPFDARRVELTGKAVPIADHVLMSSGQTFAVFSVSQNGILALQAGDVSGNQLSWFDRTGKQLNVISGERDVVIGPRLSPDGRKLAALIYALGSSHGDIWLYDLAREVRTRFTFESGLTTPPVWSPDGSQIAFGTNRPGRPGIYARASNGAGGDVEILEERSAALPTSWSPDGRFLAYLRTEQTPPASRRQIWILPLFGDRKPFAFLPSAFDERMPVFSPDSRWIAYTSNDSGAFQVYVAAFPGGGTKLQVSASGGLDPVWRPDGKELFYIDPSGRLMVSEVKAVGGMLELGTPRSLFQTHAASPGAPPFDVSHTGDRFVITTTPNVNPSPYTLVINWDAELKKK